MTPTPPADWAQVAGEPPPARSWAAVLVAWLLTAVPMYVQLRHLLYESRPTLVVLAALLVVLAIGRGAPMVALVLSAAFVPAAQWYDNRFAGPPIAVAVALGLCWAVANGAFAPRWRRWPSTIALRPMVLPLLLADLVLLLATGLRAPALLIGTAAVLGVLAIIAPAPMTASTAWLQPALGPLQRAGRANVRLMDRVGAPIGRVLGAVAMLPAAALTLLVWLGQRLVWFDPLDHARGSGSRWLSRQGEDLTPERSFAEVRVVAVGSRGRTLHRLVSAVLPMAVLGGLAVFVVQGVRDGGPATAAPEELQLVTSENCGGDGDESMQGQQSWPLVGCETTEYALRARFDAVTVYRYEDIEGSWVNVRDGVRRTWSPPDCDDCERLTVWWFGGSAAWGYYQADEWTLPSQLARRAWEQGLALDITNYAQPGWTLGQSVRKFIDLTATEDPPDVVVFYDGANDVILQRDRNDVGRGDDESEISFAEDVLDEVLTNGPFDWGLRAEDRDTDDTPRLEPEQVAEHAMARYRRNLELASSYAESIGTVPIFVWQPILPFAPDRIGNDGASPPMDRANWNTMRPAIRANLPDQVVDLSDSLDDADRVVFKDYVHTSEHGAFLTAEALLAEVDDDLREVAQPSESGRR